MEHHLLIAEVRERLQSLLNQSREFSFALPAVAQLVLRVERALPHAEDREIHRPVQIALLGGTGVGKSQLFNALLGQPETSPTSQATRCYTARPVAAANPADRPLLGHLEALGARLVETGLPGLVLVDTPDVDGALRDHHETTRQIVESSDAVVYVTCPDKRADLDVDEEVRSWAVQKRWFFVLNKADREDPHDLADIRADFDRRLRDMGFELADQTRFLVSAIETEEYDFHRLKEVLFSTRPVEAVRAMRLSNFFGYAAYAFKDNVRQAIQAQAGELAAAEDRLNQRVREIYDRVFAQEAVQEQLKIVVREQTWRRLGERLGGPMYLAAALRCRLGMLGASLSLGRAISRGGGGGLIYYTVSSLVSALRGQMPVWQVAEAIERGCRKELENIREDARQVLRERGLGHLCEENAEMEEEKAETPKSRKAEIRYAESGRQESEAETQKSADSSAMERAAAGLVRKLGEKVIGRLPDRTVQEQVQQELDRMATNQAQRLSGPLVAFLVNLPVWVMLGWFLYRIGMGWWQEKYLPGGAYLMALGLTLAAFLPGYLWMAGRVRRAAEKSPAGMLAALDEPSATQPLRDVRRRLEALAQEAEQLRQSVDRTQSMIEAELQPAEFGVRPVRPARPFSEIQLSAGKTR